MSARIWNSYLQMHLGQFSLRRNVSYIYIPSSHRYILYIGELGSHMTFLTAVNIRNVAPTSRERALVKMCCSRNLKTTLLPTQTLYNWARIKFNQGIRSPTVAHNYWQSTKIIFPVNKGDGVQLQWRKILIIEPTSQLMSNVKVWEATWTDLL